MGRRKTDKKSKSLLEREEEEETFDEFAELDEEDRYDSNGNLNYPIKNKEGEKDKIFNNAYNTGGTSFRGLPDIKADSEYAGRHLGHVYNAEEYVIRNTLSEMCSDAFDESQWAELPLDKKFSKDLMPYIFNDLFNALDKDGYSVVDIFIAIAEFMDVSYEKVYWATGMKVKERLIAECNVKFGSLDRKDINRLF